MKDTLLELIAAAKHVVACWPTNQLADAVNHLERLALEAEAELEDPTTPHREGELSSPPPTIWLGIHNHRHGDSYYAFSHPITVSEFETYLGDLWEPDREEYANVEKVEITGATARPPRVVIIVAGGVVTDVLCSDATTRVELLDHDNAETKAERDTLCLREAEAEAELHSVPIH